ncbi:MAG: hypothetical protein LKH33_12050, partial [Acetobacter sp.]|nr:hypothetical protein [Acetobacter sp.]
AWHAPFIRGRDAVWARCQTRITPSTLWLHNPNKEETVSEIDQLKAEIKALEKRVTDFSVNAILGHMMSTSLIMEISRLGIIGDADLKEMIEKTRARVVATAGGQIDENESVRRATHFLAEMASVLSGH